MKRPKNHITPPPAPPAPQYEPPPRPHPVAGPAIVSPAYVESKAGYRTLAAHALANAGHEAADAAHHIHTKYGKR